jgi:hypothetical protein
MSKYDENCVVPTIYRADYLINGKVQYHVPPPTLSLHTFIATP